MLGILRVQCKYYVELYSCDENVEFTYVNNGKYANLSNKQNEYLEKETMREEILDNLKIMESNKVPVPDGLPKEF